MSYPSRSIDLKQARNIASALFEEKANIFDQPLGVSEACLSPSQVQDILMGGASDETSAHLLSCQACLETVTLLGQVRLESDSDFVARALLQAKGGPPQVMRHPILSPSALRPLPAILAVTHRVFHASEILAGGLTLDLVPGFDPARLSAIRVESLRMNGALEATNGFLAKVQDFNADSKPDYLRIEVKGPRLGQHVEACIQKRQRVIDTVHLRGSFEGEGKLSFAGQAILEFLP